MKKITISILNVIILITLSSCFLLDLLRPWPVFEKKAGAIDFVDLSINNIRTNFINLYYVSADGMLLDSGTVPYVNADEFYYLIRPVINWRYIEHQSLGNGILSTKFRMGGGVFMGIEVDFNNSTVTIDSFDYFRFLGADLSDTEIGMISVVESFVNDDYVETITIDLLNYGLPLFYIEGLFLMPLHVANTLYSGDWFTVFYNGDYLYGLTFDQIDNQHTIARIYNSSLNHQSMSVDFMEYTRNFTYFYFSYFYGLRGLQLELNNIDTLARLIDNSLPNLTSANNFNFTLGMRDFIISLDDLHTSMIFPGVFLPPTWTLPQLTLNDLGPRERHFHETRNFIRPTVFGPSGSSLRNMFEIDGDTLIIFFTEFNQTNTEAIKTYLMSIPANIKNIVWDLSFNTGGVVGSAIELLGFFMKDIPLNILNPTDNTMTGLIYQTTHKSTVRMLAQQQFVLTSAVTYSAANLMAVTLALNNSATLIGQRASGGSCAIAYVFLPDGTLIVHSSLMQLTDNDFNAYYFEFGKPVHFLMENVTSRSELRNLIANINALRP